MTARHLECCICGGGAGSFEQHWNRDTGYGVCPSCVAEEAARSTPEQLEQLYGKPGVNYRQPTVSHMGRRFNLMAICRESQPDVANAFMSRTAGASVLCITDGTVYIAHVDDKGEPQ